MLRYDEMHRIAVAICYVIESMYIDYIIIPNWVQYQSMSTIFCRFVFVYLVINPIGNGFESFVWLLKWGKGVFQFEIILDCCCSFFFPFFYNFSHKKVRNFLNEYKFVCLHFQIISSFANIK